MIKQRNGGGSAALRPQAMKLSTALLGLAALLGAAGALRAADVLREVPGNAPEISYEGRCVVAPDGAVSQGYAGIVTRVNFRGTGLILRARTSSDELYLDVVIDGGAASLVKVPKGESDVALAQRLMDGDHRVAIFKRVEAGVGILELVSFAVTGEFLPPSPLPGRRLMFLGDSFTSGQATTVEDGGPPMDPSKAMRQNARLCYGRLLADRLHAQCHIIAVAGKGVVRDWQGLRNVRLAPDYYENALPDDDATRWDPGAYVPDAIGVCLGNNDFDAGVPDQVEYVQRYAEFVRKLRRDAPSAHIFLITSPSLTDAPGRAPKRSVQKAYLDEVVQRLGDPRIQVIPIAHHDGVPGDWHPSGTAHRAVADELEPLFRQALGW
jgi:lysophospholipase L1-like esterase